MLARSDNPFGFSGAQSDWPYYQRIVKNYYTVGYSSRNPLAHPLGSWYRDGKPYPVAWNGLDGTQASLCNKRLTLQGGPGGAGWIKKRDAGDDDKNPAVESVCAAFSSSPTTTSSTPSATPTVSSKGSIVVYFAIRVCDDELCPGTFFLYPVAKTGDYPGNVCNAGPIAQDENLGSSNSMSFTLKGIDGAFVYQWTDIDNAGSVTGPGIPTPVSCSGAPKPTPSTKCQFTELFGRKKRKRDVPERPIVVFNYQQWASCSWG